MPTDLTRNIKIYISRTGLWAHAETGSQKQMEIVVSGKSYRLCASVDSTAQAWRMMDKFCNDFHDGQYFLGIDERLTDVDFEKAGVRIEHEYQRIKGD